MQDNINDSAALLGRYNLSDLGLKIENQSLLEINEDTISKINEFAHFLSLKLKSLAKTDQTYYSQIRLSSIKTLICLIENKKIYLFIKEKDVITQTLTLNEFLHFKAIEYQFFSRLESWSLTDVSIIKAINEVREILKHYTNPNIERGSPYLFDKDIDFTK